MGVRNNNANKPRERSPIARTAPELASEAQIRSYQRRLRRLTSELSLAEARERQAIASDLHDHIGQALAYVAQKVSTLRGNAVFSGLDRDIAEILTIIDQTIRYTRDLTVEISPPVLYELGLWAAIDWLAERARCRYTFDVVISSDGEPKEISEDIAVLVFKSVQELIVNAAKHAGARHLKLTAHWRTADFSIAVEDDGVGFEPEAIANKIAESDCFGLFSIRERLSCIGGDLELISSPGAGTTSTITTPYQSSLEDRCD